MKTIIVNHRSSHHAQNSGYGRLADYLDGAIAITGASHLPYRMAKFIGNLSKQNAGLYDSNSVQKELQLYAELKRTKKPTIVHYLNAERDIRYLAKYYKREGVKLVGTFHKPPEVLNKTITNTSFLKQLDAAICVGNNQVEFVKNWLHLDQVTYIPHGIDTRFFIPDLSKKAQTLQILFVGQHLRDFEMFNRCIPEILKSLPYAQVAVVLKKEFVKKIQPHKSIQVYSGLNDLELRNWYQSSHVLFLPLHDATACNSILEAMACGLPIVTSSVGGIADYLEGTDNVLCDPQDKAGFIESAIALLKDKERLKQLGIASREKALEFDWGVVAKKVKDFYLKPFEK